MARRTRPTPPPCRDFIARLIYDLAGYLDFHPFYMKAQGLKLMNGVDRNIDFDLEEKEVHVKVNDGRKHQELVSLDWLPEVDDDTAIFGVYCACDIFDFGNCCPHTWAAANYLLAQLRIPQSPLRRQFEGQEQDAWKRVLNPLDQYLKTHQPAAPATPAEGLDKSYTQRLIYKVETNYSGLAVNVYEQSVLKNGEWGKGRKVIWNRLASDPYEFLGPVDQKIRELARAANGFSHLSNYSFSGSYMGNSSPEVWDVLSLLQGHPFVFNATDTSTPLTITKADVELSLEPRPDEMLAIAPTIAGRPAGTLLCERNQKHGAIYHNLPKHEVFLWEAHAPRVHLVQQLALQPVLIPRTGVSEVLPRLTQLEGSFKITYPPDMEGQTVAGNPQTIVRLIPRAADGGLAVEIWVRPLANGTYFEPGEGVNNFAFWMREERVAVERDLVAERIAAEDCQHQLKLQRFTSHRPWRWLLDGGDATLDFLSELQERKEAPWIIEWSNSAVPRPLIVGEITPSNVALEIESDHDWFGVEGTIDVGGEQVPLMAVLDALRNNSKYVQIKGGQWAKIAAEFRDRLAALADLLHRHKSKLNLDVTAVPLLENLFQDQQINIKAAKEWRAALNKLEKAREHTPQLPADLKADLRDYQVDGFRWLSRLAAWGVGGCLADDMGLGKTVQALAVILERKQLGPTLVIAPVSVGFNWVNETARFAPSLRPHLYRDTERGEFLETVTAGDLVVASYGLLLRDAEQFTHIRWGTLILDEAQFIKNSRTKSAQVVRDLRADWKLALTGTPVENQLSDLWSLFRATSPGLFGSWERFRERFADPIEKQKLPERQQALARTVRPFILRRTKEEVLKELPARTEMILAAELSKPERKLYEDARLLALAQISGIDTGKNEARFQVLAMLTRLRQLACHPQLVDEKWTESSAKLDVLLETIEEIREGKHRALIFSQFTSHLDLIRKALDARKISYLYLDGQTPAKQRRERVEAFQAGEGDLFLISLKAGGTGLNLTGADYVIHMDPWWNPAVEDQATDRAHRIGQTKPVMVYRLVATDTIEEKILALHEKKRNLVAGIMDGSDQAGKLSTDELIDLIRTSHVPEEATESPKPVSKSRARRKTSSKVT